MLPNGNTHRGCPRPRRLAQLVAIVLVLAGAVGLVAGAWVAWRRGRGRVPFRRPPFVDIAFKVPSRFLVADDGTVIMGVNEAGRSELYAYGPAGRRKVLSAAVDVTEGFYDGDRLIGLSDPLGDGNLVPTDPAIAALVPKGAERLVGAPDHRGAIVHTGSHQVRWLDFAARRSQFIRNASQRVDVSFCTPTQVALAVDGNLLLYDTASGQARQLAPGIVDRKRNPFCAADGSLVFAARAGGEFYAIHRLDHVLSEQGAAAAPQVLLREDHELFLPQLHQGWLYYLAVVDSAYLLRRLELATGRREDLTTAGVVYDYRLAGPGRLVYSFRDVHTAAAVLSLSLVDRRVTVLETEHSDLDFGVERVPAREGRSTAFVFHPPAQTRPAGTMLYFNSLDTSPRWETILMGLAYQGYTIYSPNYPGSAGFGRSYEDAPRSAAVTDLGRWADYLASQSAAPRCFLSVSAGNMLLEQVLAGRRQGVAAAIALFGRSSGSEYLPPVPTLFVLGENDPIVQFSVRSVELRQLAGRSPNVQVRSYRDVGHSIRGRDNLVDLLRRSHEFCQERR
jgi:hypothetical protein